jgi:hypothetical protein
MSKLVCIPLPPGWRDVSGGLPYELTRFVPEGGRAGDVLEIELRSDLQGRKRPRGEAGLRKLAIAFGRSRGAREWWGETVGKSRVGPLLELNFRRPKSARMDVWYHLPQDKGLPVIQVSYTTHRQPGTAELTAAYKIANGLFLTAAPRGREPDGALLPWYRVVEPRVKRRPKRRKEILGKSGAQILRGFEYVEGLGHWEGRRRLPSWGETVDVWINCDDEEPTDRQLELLETILRYDGDLRPEFERKVGKWYKDFYEIDPRSLQLERPADIWKLVEKGETILVIPSRPLRKAVEFYLFPGCDFEPEEGVAVRYRDWKATWVGYQNAAD